MPMKLRLRHIGIVLILLAVVGCKQDEGQPLLSVQSESIHKFYEQGSVRLDYAMNHSVIRVADSLEVTLTLYAPEDDNVAFPQLESMLGEFVIADQYEDLPELADMGILHHRKTMVLEPGLAGKYTIPSLQIDYWQKEKTDDKDSFITEEIQITVNSLLEKDQQNLDISDIAPPVSLPSKKIYWIVAGILLVALLVGGLLWWKSRRKGKEETLPPKPAHVIAMKALDVLLAGDLVKQGCIKEFYLAISDILRRYIENRFALHAPERTTEEFLAELGATSVLQIQYKTLLQEFLVHCDQVKFAKYQPADEEINKTMELCRQFISDTKQADNDGGGGS